MTTLSSCGGRWPRLPLVGSCLALALSVAVLPEAALAADGNAQDGAAYDALVAHVDRAQTLKLPEQTATLVIGNPLIADAVVQPGGVAVITAKSYGATNLVALDRNGNTLMDRPVQVTGPDDKVVLVYRGIERETYSCAPNCERRLTVGDSAASLSANLQALTSYSAAALGQQQKP